MDRRRIMILLHLRMLLEDRRINQSIHTQGRGRAHATRANPPSYQYGTCSMYVVSCTNYVVVYNVFL